MKDLNVFFAISSLFQVFATNAVSLSVPQESRNASRPTEWLKPLLPITQNQHQKTKYALISNKFDPDIMPLIVGGAPVVYEQIPHQALLLIDNTFLCGGALISSRYVVTAAHCLHNRVNVVVTLGTIDWTLVSEPSRWTETTTTKIIHEQFILSNFLNDIALILLNHDAPFNTYIYPITLPRFSDAKNTLVGLYATASGWGWTADNGDASTILISVQMFIISNLECTNTYGSTYITPASICCSGGGAKSTCRGDSGGPLTAVVGGLRRLIGIASFGTTTCESGYPQAFTRVTSFLNWISLKTGIRISP